MNDALDSDDFPTTYFTASHMAEWVSTSLLGCLSSVRVFLCHVFEGVAVFKVFMMYSMSVCLVFDSV